MPTLVPFAAQHFATLSGWFLNEKDLVQWGGPDLTYPLDPAQLASMLEDGHGSHPGRLCWMAEDEAGDLVGHAQLVFDWRNGVARVRRVAIAPHMRGQGLAIPMLRTVLAEAFAQALIERVELNVYCWNEAAIRTYSRLGFVQEGIRRSSAKVADERWDTAIMGMLRSEWNLLYAG
ncbi:GNAT family N-acetyltransferase [Mesorhizobium sp. ArgA1]